MVYDFSGPESRPFSGPKSGTRMEQLFGARIGARIEQLFGARGSWLWMFLQELFGGHRFNLHICVHQPFFRGPNGIRLFGARIRDPNGTAFRGPNQGPNRTTFRGPGLLAVHVSLGVLWRPPFLCPPAIFSGPEWYTTFRGSNPGPEWNSVSGPESGPYNRTTFRGPGSWLRMFLWGLFGGHRFNLHICVHQPSFRGPNGIRLFGGRIRDPNGTAFRGPNRGPNRTTFRGPGLLAVDVSPGAL